jgi:RimJ/RimL family protein N-acetyltransferase
MNIDSIEGLSLRPALPPDREKIHEWLCRSDITACVMGPPLYPDHPVPTLEEFARDYHDSFFGPEGDGRGRVFLIVAQGEEVGAIGYDLLDREKDRVVLDIWMRSERFCGRGHGSRALDALVRHLRATYGVGTFIISPSARNGRAVAAYRKAGFESAGLIDRQAQEAEFGLSEYDDNLLMIRRFQM